MDRHKETLGEADALRDHLPKVWEASLRVTASIDLETVLQAVVENARDLVGARHGVVMVVDDESQTEDFVTSGFTQEQHRQLLEFRGLWEPHGSLPQLTGRMMLRDLADRIRRLGILGEMPGTSGPRTALLAAPLRYRDSHVGNLLLFAKQAGPEFTEEDQKVLVLFASQAATAIANACRYRDERRARADMEALVDATPVGLVVFDATSAELLSANREAWRIVGGSRVPGHSPEQLLETLTVRRGDGSAIPLEKVSLARELGTATPVRAEEIVIEIPDGRRVPALVNATTIRSAGSGAESVAVTMQDMTPLQDLGRVQAECLGVVGRELRAPLLSVKGCTATALDSRTISEPREMHQFFRIIDRQVDRMRHLIGDLLDASRIGAGTLSVELKAQTVATLVEAARNTFLGAGGKHPLRIDIRADMPRVQADQRRIVQVLGNLLANAARHSPEQAPIRIAAEDCDEHVEISVTDEGVGVRPEMLPHLFRNFFRSGGEGGARETGGTGLGLTICKGLVEAHGGRIWAESGGSGQGTRFTFSLPIAEQGTPRAAPDRTRAAAFPGQRVLVVDSDPDSLPYVRQCLEQVGYSVVVAGDPGEVPPLLEEQRPDLVLLGVVVSGKESIELLEETLRMRDVPVIFLYSYGDQEPAIRALEKGAADYVVRPFSPTELVGRVRAALAGRRAGTGSLTLGDLAIDSDEQRAALAGQQLKLNATEYKLLRELTINAGRVVSHEVLLGRVWSECKCSDVRRVHDCVRQLRRKLGDRADSPVYIFSVRGVGYRMVEPETG